ncbi:ligase-associated DNA damage response endonuclease PdeM [Sandaracinobacteroides saxicola]|nr:ligase-associated DNA damage response endonuclease PdeM [Sandaracinobacteroides saxicola]
MYPLPCGALFWPAESALLVADLHLEKASWLASHGQPLPPYDSLDTLQRLASTLAATAATRLFALGDSFHDPDGPGRLPGDAVMLLDRLLRQLDWTWVGGNHDGLAPGRLGGRVVEEARLAGVSLRHIADPAEGGAEISGHWHPKVRIALRTGRQVSRRCFALSANKLVLPAYGSLTGGLRVDDRAFRAAMPAAITAMVPLKKQLLQLAVAG